MSGEFHDRAFGSEPKQVPEPSTEFLSQLVAVVGQWDKCSHDQEQRNKGEEDEGEAVKKKTGCVLTTV